MVGAGEKGGLLAEILARLATYLENTARLRKKVKSAMMYPTVVTVVAILITIFLLVKVVPVFGEIFTSFNATLPAPTLYLIKISNFVKQLPHSVRAGRRRGRATAGSISSRPRRAGCSGIRAASSCRSSAPSPTRFAWRGSPAPWPR